MLFAQRKGGGGNNLWGHPIESPVARPAAGCPFQLTVTLATSKFFQSIIKGITNWIRFVKRKTMSPLVAPPCGLIQPCKILFFSFSSSKSIRLDSTGFFLSFKFRNWLPNEIDLFLLVSRFLTALTEFTLFFSFFTVDCLCMFFFGTHTASCFLGRGLRSIENCLLLLCNGPLIKEVMLCVQNSAAAVPHTSLSPTGPIACTGSALTAAVRRPPGRAASRTAHRFKSTVDDDRVHRRHSAWDLAR